MWAGLIYLHFAVGTTLAHQFAAYGVCAVSGSASAAQRPIHWATFVDLVPLHFASTAVLLLLSLGVIVVSGVVWAYIGLQIHRGIQRLSTR